MRVHSHQMATETLKRSWEIKPTDPKNPDDIDEDSVRRILEKNTHNARANFSERGERLVLSVQRNHFYELAEVINALHSNGLELTGIRQ